MTSIICVTHQLQSGPRTYEYSTIAGKPAYQHILDGQRRRRQEKRLSLGMKPYQNVQALSQTPHFVKLIQEQRENGVSYRAIARNLNVSDYIIRRVCKLNFIA